MWILTQHPAQCDSTVPLVMGRGAAYLNQARATYPGGVSQLDAVLHLLHLPDEDLEVGEVTIFVEVAGEEPSRPRLTNPVYDGTRPTCP